MFAFERLPGPSRPGRVDRRQTGRMQVVIRGRNLPGTMFRNAGVPIHNVHVGVQIRDEPADLVPADAQVAQWHVDVRVIVDDAGAVDFRGPAVHGLGRRRLLALR